MSMFGMFGVFSLDSPPSASDVARTAERQRAFVDYKARYESNNVVALERTVDATWGLELRATGVDAAHAPMLAKDFDRSNRHWYLRTERRDVGLVYLWSNADDFWHDRLLANLVDRLAQESPDERLRLAAATTVLDKDRPLFVDMGDRLKLLDTNPATAVLAIEEMKVHAKLKWGNFVGEVRGDADSVAAFDRAQQERTKTYDLATERDAVLASGIGGKSRTGLYGPREIAQRSVLGRSLSEVLRDMDSVAGRAPAVGREHADGLFAAAASAAAGRDVSASEVRAAFGDAARSLAPSFDSAVPTRVREAIVRDAVAQRILGANADHLKVAAFAEKLREIGEARERPAEHASDLRGRLSRVGDQRRSSHAAEAARSDGRA